MHRYLLAVVVWLAAPGFAAAETCEKMTVKNAAGQVISDGMMCMGEDGVWSSRPAEPATAQSGPVAARPAPADPLPDPEVPAAEEAASVLPQLEPEPVAELSDALPEPAVEPVPVVLEPQPLAATAPSLQPDEPVEPAAAPEPAIETVINSPLPEVSPAPEIVPLPVAAPATDAVKTTPAAKTVPASDQAARKEAYAKLGLVCVAEMAVFCSGGCTGKCAGKQGWCDGKSGKIYPSLEAIERRHCKPE